MALKASTVKVPVLRLIAVMVTLPDFNDPPLLVALKTNSIPTSKLTTSLLFLRTRLVLVTDALHCPIAPDPSRKSAVATLSPTERNTPSISVVIALRKLNRSPSDAATASPEIVATPYRVFLVIRNSPILDADALDCAVEKVADTPCGRVK